MTIEKYNKLLEFARDTMCRRREEGRHTLCCLDHNYYICNRAHELLKEIGEIEE